MKNQWPFWLFIVAILVVVFISLNYQGKEEVSSLGDIFPDENQAYDYEYNPSVEETLPSVGSAPVSAVDRDLDVVESVLPTVNDAVPVQPQSQPAAIEKKAPAQPAAIKTGKIFTIQILSSKDLKATEAALKKVKDNGFSDAYIKTADLGEKGKWHRIYIGSFETKAVADQGLVKVKEKYPQAFLTMASQ